MNSGLLQAALIGLERQRDEVEEQISEVRQILGGRCFSGRQIAWER